MFDTLNCDVITFQELKVQKSDIESYVVHIPGYESYISVPTVKKGYSGVAVYVKQPPTGDETYPLTVVKAEEGLTGWLPSKDIKGYSIREVWEKELKSQHENKNNKETQTQTNFTTIGGYPDIDKEDGLKLDGEGRCIILEFINGVILICLYCPANSTGTNDEFRTLFFNCLIERIKNIYNYDDTLISKDNKNGNGSKAGGKRKRQIIIMGDLNVSRDLIDSAESITELAKKKIIKRLPTWDFNYNNIDEIAKNEISISSVFQGKKFEEINHKIIKQFRNETLQRLIFHNNIIEDSEALTNSINNENENDNRLLCDIIRNKQDRRLGMYTCWNILKNSRPGNHGSRIDYILITKGLYSSVRKANILPFIQGSDHCPIFTDFNFSYNYEVNLKDLNYCYKLPKLASTIQFSHLGKTNGKRGGPLDSMFASLNNKKQKIKENQYHSLSLSLSSSLNTPYTYNSKLKKPKQQSISSFFKPSTVTKVKDIPDTEQLDKEQDTEPTPWKNLNDDQQLFVTDSPTPSPKKHIPSPIDKSQPLSTSATDLRNMLSGILNGKISTPVCSYHKSPCILKTSKTSANKNRQFWICSKPYGDFDQHPTIYRCNFFKWHD